MSLGEAEDFRRADDLSPEITVLLSGGIDSAACLNFYFCLGRPVCALNVNYGQGAAEQETRAAARLANFYGIPIAFRRLEAAGMKSVGEIRGRNAFLVQTAAMESLPSVTAIALGIHAGTPYSDCSPSFVVAMNGVLQLQSRRVELLAPFLTWTKGDVLQYCAQRSVPIQLTYSCEKGGDVPCGMCSSCLDRRALHACP